MSNFSNDMKEVYIKSKSSIENSYRLLGLIDEDFQTFLLEFFREDANKNLFLTQIFYNGNEYIVKFQDYLFNKACAYFTNLIKIDGLKFYFDSTIPLSNIDFIISDSKIASVNIFYKYIIIYEKAFFKTIDEGIENKHKKIDSMNKAYNKETKKINNSSFLNFEKENNIGTNIINSTIFKNKIRKEKLSKLEEISYEILNLENELSELLVVRNMLEKNLVNIKYFQEKITTRIINKLHYKIINE